MANCPADETGFCQELLMLGRWHATRRGLTGEDAEDCAAEYTLYVLTLLHSSEGKEALMAVSVAPDPTWLHRRARTHTRNFHRVVLTHADRCSSLMHAGMVEEAGQGAASTSEAVLLRAEFWGHIFAALDRLDAIPRHLLIGRHIWGESTRALAAACGRSEHAVEQTLARARQQMQRTLERRGCGETAMREYVAAFMPHDPPVYAVARVRTDKRI